MISAPLEKRRRKKRKRLPVYKKSFQSQIHGLWGEGWGLVIHLKSIGSYIKKSIILTISREQDQELIRVELSALARKERVKCLCHCGGDRAKVARGVRLAAGKVPTRPRHTCPAAGSPLELEHSSPSSHLLAPPPDPPQSTEHCDWLYGIFGHETSCTRYWTCWNGEKSIKWI